MNIAIIIIASSLVPAYFLCSATWQNAFLLILSVLFVYTFFPNESHVLFLATLILYGSAIIVRKRQTSKWLVISCIVFAGILVIVREECLITRSLVSFYILNSIAFLHLYVNKTERSSFIHGVLYLMYFPKLICGPYEKPEGFIAVLRERRVFSMSAIVQAINLILLGVLERYALAGNVANIRFSLLNQTTQIPILPFLFSGTLYGLEAFFVISAFTNWAKGLSLLFGIPISDNFNSPFLAKSVSEYWRRWHISVHSWMKEHVYLPLRGSGASVSIGILITFIISGISGTCTLRAVSVGTKSAMAAGTGRDTRGCAWKQLVSGSSYTNCLLSRSSSRKRRNRFTPPPP